jgi:phage/plasmid-like protein (TIGR03299 family)
VPGDFYVPGVSEDLVENYILLASSHDGSLHVTAKSTPVRVVCNNTLSMALAHASTTVQIRHTASAKYELAAAHTVLGLATKRSQALKEAAEALVSLKVTRKFFKGFVRALFPSVKERQGEEASAKAIHHREAVELLFSTQLNNLPGMAGTGWSLYNAVTEYVDHKMPARRGTDTLDRAWFGTGEELKLKAFRLLAQQIDPNFEEA